MEIRLIGRRVRSIWNQNDGRYLAECRNSGFGETLGRPGWDLLTVEVVWLFIGTKKRLVALHSALDGS
jgi:hypothetical protein